VRVSVCLCLKCDVCGLPAVWAMRALGTDYSLADLTASAAAIGWCHDGGRDFCALCDRARREEPYPPGLGEAVKAQALAARRKKR
jgi:hypothetical protein